MKRLRYLWNVYKHLGVLPELTEEMKRRVILMNIVSLVLTFVILFLNYFLYKVNLSSLLLLGSFLSLFFCIVVPFLNSLRQYTLAAIFFSLIIPFLVFSTQLIHKITVPFDQIEASEYYRSNLWLICSVAFPFLSVDPKRKPLLISLTLFPLVLIFSLNPIFGLFDKDFVRAGYDILILRRHNMVSLLVALVLIMIFYVMEDITNKLRKEVELKTRKLEEQTESLFEKNLLLESKNEEIQTQADQLKEFNEHLEEIVIKRTLKIQEQNEKLLNYAFSNSHLVRAPLARILGITELLEVPNDLTPEVKEKLLSNIRISALELDEIIRKVGVLISVDISKEENQQS